MSKYFLKYGAMNEFYEGTYDEVILYATEQLCYNQEDFYIYEKLGDIDQYGDFEKKIVAVSYYQNIPFNNVDDPEIHADGTICDFGEDGFYTPFYTYE